MACSHSTFGDSSLCSQCMQVTPRIVELVDGMILIDGHDERPNTEPVTAQVQSARRRGSHARRRK